MKQPDARPLVGNYCLPVTCCDANSGCVISIRDLAAGLLAKAQSLRNTERLIALMSVRGNERVILLCEEVGLSFREFLLKGNAFQQCRVFNQET